MGSFLHLDAAIHFVYRQRHAQRELVQVHLQGGPGRLEYLVDGLRHRVLLSPALVHQQALDVGRQVPSVLQSLKL